jgi:hypothetical protein
MWRKSIFTASHINAAKITLEIYNFYASRSATKSGGGAATIKSDAPGRKNRHTSLVPGNRERRSQKMAKFQSLWGKSHKVCLYLLAAEKQFGVFNEPHLCRRFSQKSRSLFYDGARVWLISKAHVSLMTL